MGSAMNAATVSGRGAELGLQFGASRAKNQLRIIVALLVICERRCHVAEGGRTATAHRVRGAQAFSAAASAPQRIAMVALATSNEALALRLAAFDKILPCQFDGGFDRFRSAADEVSVGEAARFIANEPVGQRLRRLRREKTLWA